MILVPGIVIIDEWSFNYSSEDNLSYKTVLYYVFIYVLFQGW